MTASRDDEAVTALALAAARGHERALEAFIKATQHDVWRFVAYLSDAGSADDLTQETFLRAIGAIERFSGRSSARTWLLAIARRVVADHIRHAQSRPRTATGGYPEHLVSGDRHARGFEDLVEVTTMIAGLNAEQREALLLTQLLGLPYADAAAVCGCPVGTIRSRVARARDALLAEHRVDALVTKNSGGDMTRPKLDAAAALDIPVVMVARPPLPDGVTAVGTVQQAADWVAEVG